MFSIYLLRNELLSWSLPPQVSLYGAIQWSSKMNWMLHPFWV